MAKDEISILDGSTFVVSDRHGDVEAGPDQVQGLFYRDTRFLSRRILTVDGRRPDVLSVENGKYFEVQFFLYPPTRSTRTHISPSSGSARSEMASTRT